MGNTRIELTGQIFGRLTVLNYDHSTDKNTYWLCLCDTKLGGCGKEKIISRQSLISGSSQSCGCMQRESRRLPNGIAAFNELYGSYKHRSDTKKFTFELSIDEFRNLTSSNCFYCGIEPIQTVKMNKFRFPNGNYLHNGIDRLNSLIGYTIENCVPCCKFCNIAKNNMTTIEFYKWIERLAHNQGYIRNGIR